MIKSDIAIAVAKLILIPALHSTSLYYRAGTTKIWINEVDFTKQLLSKNIPFVDILVVSAEVLCIGIWNAQSLFTAFHLSEWKEAWRTTLKKHLPKYDYCFFLIKKP